MDHLSNPSRSIVVRSSPYLSTLESSLEPSANETQGRATCLALDFVAFEWLSLQGNVVSEIGAAKPGVSMFAQMQASSRRRGMYAARLYAPSTLFIGI